ncbi:MAG: HAMP domain-containing sensor histidine kinase [Armatimonadia bacterium]
MDIPLRSKLLASFLGVAVVGAGTVVTVGWILIHRLGLPEAERSLVLWTLISSAVPAVGIGAFMGLYLAGRLSRRIQMVTGAAVELEHGNLEARVPEPEHAQQDEVKRLQVIFNDMASALQLRDEELRRSHQQLEETTGELQRWNQSYLATLEFITHELKNQIASAKLNLLAVRDGYVGELNAEQREALGDVMDTINRTEEMLVNYLNLSRIEKGELQVRARPVQVEREVVAPVLRELKGRLADKGMQVETDLPPDLITQADPSLLQTVYENLLTNATKYGRVGGHIKVWGKRLNGMLEMHVWNEGQGVAEDQLDQLFGKFCRLAPPEQQERGTGLGLFIDREIVRKHGGEIWAQSQFGEWIDFVFTLPRPDEMLEESVDSNQLSVVSW